MFRQRLLLSEPAVWRWQLGRNEFPTLRFGTRAVYVFNRSGCLRIGENVPNLGLMIASMLLVCGSRRRALLPRCTVLVTFVLNYRLIHSGALLLCMALGLVVQYNSVRHLDLGGSYLILYCSVGVFCSLCLASI